MEKLIRLLILFLLVSCVKIIPVDNTEKYVYNLKYTIEYRTPKTIDFNFQSEFDDLKYECNYYRIEKQSELIVYSEKEDVRYIVYRIKISAQLTDISLTKLE